MGVNLMEFCVYMRKGLIFTIREHTLLICVMCASIYMWRWHPFAFSLILSASPVLLCTAALLGILLLSGQESVPEPENRYKAVSVKSGMMCDANLDRRNEGFSVERCRKSKRDDDVDNVDEIRVVGEEKRSVGDESENSEAGEGNEEFDESTSEFGDRLNEGEGKMDDHYAIINKVIGELLETESEHDKSEEEEDCSDYDSEREEVVECREDDVDSNDDGGSGDDDDDDGDGAGSDSGSDGAETSSPDESMDATMPTLDELHPLLDEDSSQPVEISRVGAESASSGHSPHSSSSSEETEAHDSEAVDDDNLKKDETNSVIAWTEEDQKNLMEVGSSEMERNQRLERILRRRKNMSMVPEIDLIEFENPNFQLNIAPISTARRNPFDLPQDTFDSNIPGSAPSIFNPRRNPFDLPYDDEQDERSDEDHRPTFQARQPFLKRRYNFHARPSILGQERQPARFRPFFVPEQLASEEPSYSSFQGQSSGVSSDHETESDSSVDRDEVDQDTFDIRGSDRVYEKNYSSATIFPDAYTELDPGSSSHVYHTDKQIQIGDDRDGGQVRNSFFVPEQSASEELSYSPFQGQSSGVSSDHESESDSSVERDDVDQDTLDIRSRDHVYEKSYSSATIFSDAYTELDPGLSSHGSVGDQQTRAGNERDQGQVPNSFFAREQLVSEEPSYSPFHGQSSGVSSDHESESDSSVERDNVDQDTLDIRSRDHVYEKSYSSATIFSDAHTELDPGQSSHGSVTEKQTQPSNEHDRGQVPNSFFAREQLASEEPSYSSFQGQSSGVSSDHETESDCSVERHNVDQDTLDIRSRDHVYEKSYSPATIFSDAHTELDLGQSSHGSVTEKQTQPSNEHDRGQGPNSSIESSEKERSMRRLTIPEFHELDHDIMMTPGTDRDIVLTPCPQTARVKEAESKDDSSD